MPRLQFALIITVLFPGSLFATVIETGDVSHISTLYTYVGKTGHGTMTINNNSDVTGGFCHIGKESGSSGWVTVDGTGSTYTNSESAYVGLYGTGEFNIQNGGEVSFKYGTYIGYYPGASGEVTVNGSNSKFNIGGNLRVGYYSHGTLDIINGGNVTVGGSTAVAYGDGSTGSINFGEHGGTLTTATLYLTSPDDFTGTGTINTQGLVSDLDLVFDATHGTNQTFTFNEPGQNITLNFNVSDSTAGHLGIGYRNNASMAIRDGITVKSYRGTIDSISSSPSEVTIEGDNSTWTSDSYFCIGQRGHGILNVKDGGTVNSKYTHIGGLAGSSGVVTIAGTNSTWNSTDYSSSGYGKLVIGNEGDGLLNIIEGATVNCEIGLVGFGGESGGSGIGKVVVHGRNSTWNNYDLCLDSINLDGMPPFAGNATVDILNGGLVRVSGKLYIDDDEGGDDFINITRGGMLALAGDAADSLDDFYSLIAGSKTIRWWDDSIGENGDWALLSTATYGDDYMLEYITDGNLAGHTLLTVGTVPEPCIMALITTALLSIGFCVPTRKHK